MKRNRIAALVVFSGLCAGIMGMNISAATVSEKVFVLSGEWKGDTLVYTVKGTPNAKLKVFKNKKLIKTVKVKGKKTKIKLKKDKIGGSAKGLSVRQIEKNKKRSKKVKLPNIKSGEKMETVICK